MTQEYAFCNLKYRFDKYLHLTQHRYALAYNLKDRAKCYVSVLLIKMDMEFIDIHRQCLQN